MSEPILTTTQIAKRSDYTPVAMWAKARKGEIPAERANPNGKHYRFIDSPELRAWCAERASRRVRSLARKQPREDGSRPPRRPWSWTKDHDALLNRKRPRLEPAAQDMWRNLGTRHRLTVHDLRQSIRLGYVVRTQGDVDNSTGMGLLLWEQFATQFRELRLQIGDTWRDWTPQGKALVHGLILPIVEFDRQLRSERDHVP